MLVSPTDVSCFSFEDSQSLNGQQTNPVITDNGYGTCHYAVAVSRSQTPSKLIVYFMPKSWRLVVYSNT